MKKSKAKSIAMMDATTRFMQVDGAMRRSHTTEGISAL